VAVPKKDASILLVDDDELYLSLLEGMLASIVPDVPVVTATDAWKGRQAHEQLTGPTLVISDGRMPGENGMQFLFKLSKIRREGDRLVLLSSYVVDDEVGYALNSGIDDVVSKPQGFDATYAILERLVQDFGLTVRPIEAILA
jgi:CheY-like chemotaxis protein